MTSMEIYPLPLAMNITHTIRRTGLLTVFIASDGFKDFLAPARRPSGTKLKFK